MRGIWVINRKQLLVSAACAVIVMGALFMMNRTPANDAIPTDTSAPKTRVIHMVTGEFSTTTEDGKKLEAYRWDPGTIPVNKGETVTLKIAGINGHSHPFVIEGLNIKGEVTKGEETEVTFKAEEEGIYRLICFAHPDLAHNGPMIAYIVVD
jgi:plastocyanin